MYKKILLLSMIVFCCVKCKTKKLMDLEVMESEYTLDFVDADNLIDVSDYALQQEKFIFLDIYAEWCLPCKMMDRTVFVDEDLGVYMNKHFVSYKVDAEKGPGPNIAELYKVPGYPTILFLDASGKVLMRKVGALNVNELWDMAEFVVENNQQ